MSSSSTTTTNGGMEATTSSASSLASSTSGLPGGGGTVAVSGEDRLKELEALFTVGPESVHEAKAFSTETLLDILLLLFNECCNSSLRKEKTVTDFIELGRKMFQYSQQ